MLLRELVIAVIVFVVFFVAAISLAGSGVSTSILAGAVTGLIEGIVMFPLENIKIQQQLDGKSMLSIIKKTFRLYGLAGFFKGLSPVLIGAVPTQAIRWGSFEIYCSYFDCSSLLQIALGGIFAGVLNSLVTGVPIETMKTAIIHSHFGGGAHNGASVGSPFTNHNPIASGDAYTGPLIQCSSTLDLPGLLSPSPHQEGTSPASAIDIGTPQGTSAYNTYVSSVGIGLVGGGGGNYANNEDSFRLLAPFGVSLDDISGQILPVDPAKLVQSRRFHIPNRGAGNRSMASMSLGSPTLPQMRGGAKDFDDVSESAGKAKTTIPSSAKPKSPLRGWVPTVLKKLINQAIRFPAHALVLRILCVLATGVAAEQAKTHCRSGHPYINFIAGSFAGLASIIVTQPIDVAKTRMQSLSGDRYRHTLHCLMSIMSTDGLRGFSHGIVSRSIRVAIGSGITFAIFPIFHTLFIDMAADFSHARAMHEVDFTMRPHVGSVLTGAPTTTFLHQLNPKPPVFHHI